VSDSNPHSHFTFPGLLFCPGCGTALNAPEGDAAIHAYSCADKNSWNELVHHLSGGLLYGYEVEKPAWLVGRKRAYMPKPGRKPSKRCEEVLDRRLRGWKDRQIAKDLGISFHRTRNLIARVLKQNHAHGRKELIRMMRPKKVLATDGARMDTDEKTARGPQIPRIPQMKSNATTAARRHGGVVH